MTAPRRRAGGPVFFPPRVAENGPGDGLEPACEPDPKIRKHSACVLHFAAPGQGSLERCRGGAARAGGSDPIEVVARAAKPAVVRPRVSCRRDRFHGVRGPYRPSSGYVGDSGMELRRIIVALALVSAAAACQSTPLDNIWPGCQTCPPVAAPAALVPWEVRIDERVSPAVDCNPRSHAAHARRHGAGPVREPDARPARRVDARALSRSRRRHRRGGRSVRRRRHRADVPRVPRQQRQQDRQPLRRLGHELRPRIARRRQQPPVRGRQRQPPSGHHHRTRPVVADDHVDARRRDRHHRARARHPRRHEAQDLGQEGLGGLPRELPRERDQRAAERHAHVPGAGHTLGRIGHRRPGRRRRDPRRSPAGSSRARRRTRRRSRRMPTVWSSSCCATRAVSSDRTACG